MGERRRSRREQKQRKEKSRNCGDGLLLLTDGQCSTSWDQPQQLQALWGREEHRRNRGCRVVQVHLRWHPRLCDRPHWNHWKHLRSPGSCEAKTEGLLPPDLSFQLLIALAFFDTLYIICGGINYTFRAFEEVVPFDSAYAYKITYPHLILPFLNVGLCGTIFMTVAISIERFLGICHPLHYPPHTRKSWFYILPVLVISLLVNIPKFLEAEIYWEDDINAIEILRDENVTVIDIPKYIPNYSAPFNSDLSTDQQSLEWMRLISRAISCEFMIMTTIIHLFDEFSEYIDYIVEF